MSKFDTIKKRIKEYIDDNRETVEKVAAYVTIIGVGTIIGGVSYKMGNKAGIKEGFAAGVEATNFIGKPSLSIFCNEKDKIHLVLEGEAKVGAITHEVTFDAATGEGILNDLKTCVAAAKTGLNANLLDDIFHMPPEVIELIKKSGGDVINF